MIDVYHPGPALHLAERALLAATTSGGTGSDCSPLHSSVTALICSIGSCTDAQREAPQGQGGPRLLLQWGLCKEPLWASFLLRVMLFIGILHAALPVFKSGE